MNYLELAEWAIRIYELGRRLAEAEGLPPDAFDAAVAAARSARDTEIDAKRKAEIANMDGGGR